MSGHDDLERQLRASVRARAAASASEPDPAPRRPWWRRRPLILIALPAVLVAGVATAATQLGGGHGVGYRADRLVMTVMRGAIVSGACRPVDPGTAAPVIDAGAGPRITRVLPQLATAPATPPDPDTIRMARRGAGEGLLARTVRTIDFPGGVQAVLFVSRGAGGGGFVDPEACATAARRRLEAREATTDRPVYAAATRLLRRAFASPTARESLHVGVGKGGGWGISAEGRFPPPRTLHTGVWASTVARGHDSSLAGIVRPDVALVRIVPAKGTKTRVRRTARPRQGVFVFTLPRRHGAMVIKQYAADGRYLRSDRMR